MNKTNAQPKGNRVLNFRFEAGGAKPNNKSIASGLAPLKVKLMDFCGQVNNDAEILKYKGKIVQVRVVVSPDASFKYECRGRPSSDLIKEAAGVETGSKTAGRENVGSVTEEQLRNILELKASFMTTTDPEKQLKILKGTAQSIGVSVVG